LYKKIKDFKFDLIYSNSLVIPVGAVIAGLLKIPHIWHAREFVYEDFNGQYDMGEKASMAIINCLSENIVCNSKAVEKKLLSYKYWKKPTKVVYNGFDFSGTEQIDPKKKYNQCIGSGKEINLLIAGSINSGKGQEDAIRAVNILSKKGCLVNLLIAGIGNKKYIKYLKSISKKDLVSQRINFLGYVDDIESLYQTSAITLICSRNEAFGRTAVESLAHGTPVIGTCRGGLPEIIQDNVTGLLYEHGNFLALSDRIEKLLLDRVLYERLTSCGQAYVYEHFNENRYINQIKTVLKKNL
jgi:glycosyltransferase involved in cell wall biosynthesis